jgi:hypothetical protein
MQRRSSFAILAEMRKAQAERIRGIRERQRFIPAQEFHPCRLFCNLSHPLVVGTVRTVHVRVGALADGRFSFGSPPSL